ncbi:MAG: enoyl-CoA hydratase/isomerase family protein, partial [Actinomycetota bacterium]
RARDLSFTARTFSGVEAAQWGLATASAPREGLDALVQSYIDMILPNHGPTIAACKDLYRNALDRGLSSGLAYEAAAVFPIAYDGARLDAYR